MTSVKQEKVVSRRVVIELPKALLKEVSVIRESSLTDKIYDLVKKHDVKNVNEVIIKYYLEHKVILRAKQIRDLLRFRGIKLDSSPIDVGGYKFV